MNHRLGVTKYDGVNDDERAQYKMTSVADEMRKELNEFQDMIRQYPQLITQLWTTKDPLFGPYMRNCFVDGSYIIHLRRLLRDNGGIEKDRVRIYWSEEFRNHTKSVVEDAMKFLGVDPSLVNLDNVTSERYNTHSTEKHDSSSAASEADDPGIAFPQSLREEMERTMQPFDEQLAEFLGEIPPWMKSRKMHAPNMVENKKDTNSDDNNDETESLLDAVNEAKAEHDRRAKLDHSHTLKEGKWSFEFVKKNLDKSLQKKLLDEEDVERLEELFYA